MQNQRKNLQFEVTGWWPVLGRNLSNAQEGRRARSTWMKSVSAGVSLKLLEGVSQRARSISVRWCGSGRTHLVLCGVCSHSVIGTCILIIFKQQKWSCYLLYVCNWVNLWFTHVRQPLHTNNSLNSLTDRFKNTWKVKTPCWTGNNPETSQDSIQMKHPRWLSFIYLLQKHRSRNAIIISTKPLCNWQKGLRRDMDLLSMFSQYNSTK